MAKEVSLPVLTRHSPPTDLAITAGATEVEVWFQAIVAEPCGHYLGNQGRRCKGAPHGCMRVGVAASSAPTRSPR